MYDDFNTLNLNNVVSQDKCKKLIIGNKLSGLTDQQFVKYHNLEEIDFNGCIIDKIPYRCFANCKNLKSIDLPFNIKTLFMSSFSDCTSLESIVLRGVNHIDGFTFNNCNQIKNIIIERPFVAIQHNAFDSSNEIISITCSENIKPYFLQKFPNAIFKKND